MSGPSKTVCIPKEIQASPLTVGENVNILKSLNSRIDRLRHPL